MPRISGTRFRHGWVIAAAAASAGLVPASAQGCRMYVSPTLEDVRYADVVVVGRISHYRIIRDQAFRRRMLASPRLPADLRRMYQNTHTILMSDYARFDVTVDEQLLGNSPGKFSVTWDNSTFGEPERMPAGPYVLALRWPKSPHPPLRGPSATVLPSPDPNSLTLLQAPCSGAFLYEAYSEQAQTIRKILGARKASQRTVGN